MLKNLKVEIVYTKGKTRTIKTFGKIPREQMFAYGDPEISVLEYLRDNNIDETLLDQIAISDFFWANMGTYTSPGWYPIEALKVVEHQIVKKLTPEATEKMFTVASKKPHHYLRNIVDRGLATLGIAVQGKDESILRAAGIQVSNKPIRLPAHKASFRHVEYKQQKNDLAVQYVSDNSTKWSLYKRQFYDTTNVFEGKIVVFLPTSTIIEDQNTASAAHRYPCWIANQLAEQMKATGFGLETLERTGPKLFTMMPPPKICSQPSRPVSRTRWSISQAL